MVMLMILKQLHEQLFAICTAIEHHDLFKFDFLYGPDAEIKCFLVGGAIQYWFESCHPCLICITNNIYLFAIIEQMLLFQDRT